MACLLGVKLNRIRLKVIGKGLKPCAVSHGRYRDPAVCFERYGARGSRGPPAPLMPAFDEPVEHRPDRSVRRGAGAGAGRGLAFLGCEEAFALRIVITFADRAH